MLARTAIVRRQTYWSTPPRGADAPTRVLAGVCSPPVVPLVEFLFGRLSARAAAECSGTGGLLPLTRPATSEAMADARVADHQRAGGGRLVTACGESLRRFRSRGADVVDLVELVAEALDARGCGVSPRFWKEQ